MLYTPQQILELPDERRKRLRLRRRYHPKPRKKRPRFSRDELVVYLRKTGVRSSRRLMALRSDGEPIVWDYRREFGSWSKAVDEIFGRELEPEFDDEYLLKTVVEFDLWSKEAYRLARQKDPHTFPSVHFVIRSWGRWSTFKESARRAAVKAVLEDYMKLERRLGHRPTMKECRVRGIPLQTVLKKFGGKYCLDDLLAGVERQREKRGRST